MAVQFPKCSGHIWAMSPASPLLRLLSNVGLRISQPVAECGWAILLLWWYQSWQYPSEKWAKHAQRMEFWQLPQCASLHVRNSSACFRLVQSLPPPSFVTRKSNMILKSVWRFYELLSMGWTLQPGIRSWCCRDGLFHSLHYWLWMTILESMFW